MMRALIVVALLSIGVLAGIILAGFSPVGMIVYQGKESLTAEDLAMIPYLSLEGFSEAAIGVNGSEIYLFSGCRRIVMVTNEYQTESIRSGIEGELDFRPNSHDIMKNVFETFGIEPIMVKITRMEQNVYYARIFLMQGTRILNLDVRPSDAISIAVRARAPVFVNQTLMEEQGEIVC